MSRPTPDVFAKIDTAWKLIFRGKTPAEVKTATGLPWGDIDRYFRLRQQELNS